MPRNPVPSDHRPPREPLTHMPVPATGLPDESVTARYTVLDAFGNRRVRLPGLGGKNPRMRGTPGTATSSHPTVLSDIMAERILTAIRGGNRRNTAARWAGVHERTLSAWMSRPESRFAIFSEMLLEAEAAAELTKVRQATPTLQDGVSAQEQAKNAQWWLERLRRDGFARPDNRVQVNIGAPPADADLSVYSLDELKTLRALALKLTPDSSNAAAPTVINITPDAPDPDAPPNHDPPESPPAALDTSVPP